VKGARSFKDIKAIIGLGCTILREAAGKLNLLLWVDEWGKRLKQASTFHILYQLKQIFVYLFVCLFHQIRRDCACVCVRVCVRGGLFCAQEMQINQKTNEALLQIGDPL
jgi:hypothetical protein